MCKKLLAILFILLCCNPGIGLADHFEHRANYTVCFTPGMDCTAEIISAIDDAVSNIWVQAYSFTSRPISKALVTAKERGVNVQVIFDKSALNYKNGAADYFRRHGIPIWIDSTPAIAHNKVMIVDQTKVVTGSFNFTRAAQEKNAENVLIIEDRRLAQKYLNNWQARKNASSVFVSQQQREPKYQENWLDQLLHELLKWFQKWLWSFPNLRHA